MIEFLRELWTALTFRSEREPLLTAAIVWVWAIAMAVALSIVF